MKLKKAMSLILALVMLLSMLAGCAGGTTTEPTAANKPESGETVKETAAEADIV